MTLINNILEWTQTLPAWQRDAARRLLQLEEGLSTGEHAELYDLLKAGHGHPNPLLLSRDRLLRDPHILRKQANKDANT